MAFLNTTDLGKIQDALMSRDPSACMVAQALIVTARDGLADHAMREAANDKWATDDLEIDDEPATSAGECGTWVAAWVWMPEPEPLTCRHCGHDLPECITPAGEPDCPHCGRDN